MVDDDYVTRKLVSISLGKSGISVISLEDSLEILKKAREIQPDLIMLDQMMPGKSGMDALSELKAEVDLQKIPVVIMSAKSQRADIQRCLDNGAADYLVKPVSMKELEHRLLQHIPGFQN